jgi:hypothetical protein
MKGILALGLALIYATIPADASFVFLTPRVSNYEGQNWCKLERVCRVATLLLSTRNVNENGEPFSDLPLSLSTIDGNPVILYQNETVMDDDESDGASDMSSVTDWSDFMRQDSSLPHRVNKEHGSSNDTVAESLGSVSTFKLDDIVLSKEELDQLEKYWDRLLPTVSYLGTVQVATIYKALRVAYLAHRGQMRKSGEPFIVHVSCGARFIPCFFILLT